MSDRIRAAIQRGFNRDTARWDVAIEAEAKMDAKEWETFIRDLDKFLRDKYPKLKITAGGKG